MNAIGFIRKRWLVLLFSVIFFGMLWGSFQWMYREQILLQQLYKSGTLPDQRVAMTLYREMVVSGTIHSDTNSLSLLAEVLARAEKREEAIRVWNRLVSQMPEDRGLRLRLAVALHNQGKYLEAEKHFVVLLKGDDGHE